MLIRENRVRIAKELGSCDQHAAANDIMTRGETAQRIYLLNIQHLEVVRPPIASEMGVYNPHDSDLNECLLLLNQIPGSIRRQFHSFGWKYIIGGDAVSDFSEKLRMACVGVCFYGEKAVYVSQSKATIHEISHFIHQVTGFTDEVERIFQAESERPCHCYERIL